VNDVLLSVTAGGLRSLLQHRGEPLHDTTLRAYVPVSLRRHLHGLQQGNQIAQMAVPLDLSESDPGRRLRQLAADTTLRKARPRTNLGDLLVGSRIGRRLVLSAVMRQRVNLTTASIPGPTRPLYLAGARVLDVYPVLPLVANEPLGVGAISYAGDLTIGITADPGVYPDLDALSGAIRDDLLSLGVATLPPFEGRAFPARTGSMAAVGGRTGGADSWLAPAGESTRAP
jgi:hypothetical protein